MYSTLYLKKLIENSFVTQRGCVEHPYGAAFLFFFFTLQVKYFLVVSMENGSEAVDGGTCSVYVCVCVRVRAHHVC